MSVQEAIDYHANRARTEMDRGLSADALAASRAHLELAALHMQRLRDLRAQSRPHQPMPTM